MIQLSLIQCPLFGGFCIGSSNNLAEEYTNSASRATTTVTVKFLGYIIDQYFRCMRLELCSKGLSEQVE